MSTIPMPPGACAFIGGVFGLALFASHFPAFARPSSFRCFSPLSESFAGVFCFHSLFSVLRFAFSSLAVESCPYSMRYPQGRVFNVRAGFKYILRVRVLCM